MPTELLYDIARQGFQDSPWLLAAALGLLLAALAGWRQRRRGRSAQGPAVFMVFSAVGLLAVSATLWDHQRLVARLQTGQVQVAEGEVLAHALAETARYNSSSKRYERSTWESFEVGGTAFAFRRGGGVGFHNGAEPPVEIGDGQRLRVHYVEDEAGNRSQRRILRLERLPARLGAAATTAMTESAN